MGSPVSLVIANIYMEYFEESALGPECPIPSPWWTRYVDDVHLLQPSGFSSPHINFTMESPCTDDSIPFLDTKYFPNKEGITPSKLQSTEKQPILTGI